MKKLLSIVVALFVGGVGSAFADNNEGVKIDKLVYSANKQIDIWADHAAESFAGGSGTKEDPYKITSAAELAKIAQDVREGVGEVDYKDTYFSIENDIDLAGHMWYPIGFVFDDDSFARCEFAGIVDGKGHTIKNMSISLSGFKSIGLFGFTKESFELRNLTILSGSIEGDMCVGAFVGFNNGLVENCVNYIDVKCLQYYAGGIAGSSTVTGRVYRCQNFGKVQAGFDDTLGFAAGGICGLSSSSVEECINWASVTSRTTYAAGVAGFMDGGKVVRCFNRGDVNALNETAGGIVGLVGGRNSACEISNCYVAGGVVSGAYVGGIVGIVLMKEDYPFVMRNNYYDMMLYEGGPIGQLYDNYDKCVVEDNWYSFTDEMTNPEFVNTLNAASGGVSCWCADVNNINDGYPVLEYMKDYVVGISQTENESDIRVVAEDNSIRISGTDETSAVQVYNIGGFNVFKGDVARLNSEFFSNGMYIVVVEGKSYKVFLR